MANPTDETPLASESGNDGEKLSLPRKRGRPVGSKNKPRVENGESGNSDGESLVAVDPIAVADCLVGLFEIGDEFLVRQIVSAAAKKVPADKREEFSAEVEKARLNEKDKTAFRNALVGIVKKYPFVGKFGHEFVLLIGLAQYGWRMSSLAKFVAALPEVETEKKNADLAK